MDGRSVVKCMKVWVSGVSGRPAARWAHGGHAHIAGETRFLEGQKRGPRGAFDLRAGLIKLPQTCRFGRIFGYKRAKAGNFAFQFFNSVSVLPVSFLVISIVNRSSPIAPIISDTFFDPIHCECDISRGRINPDNI